VPTGARFAFESFEVDPARRRLSAAGEPVAIPDRHLDVLLVLVARAGQIIAKDDLIQAGWKDVAVGDNSLEQAISSLRRVLGAHLIETVPRRGYRFTGTVERKALRESDAVLDDLLAPHRAFIEGRAALETLEAEHVARAREVFEQAVKTVPDQASAHVGLANASMMQFEMTRADPAPDLGALKQAAAHAREACRIDPRSGEAWATLGFVLDRTGDRLDALAASKRAITLEPDNWRHHFRLAYVAWGEERLRAADRVLALLPDFPLARWLVATVHVARQAFDEAERELQAAAPDASQRQDRFSAVALNWLLGLIHLARGDEPRALDHFNRELASERTGHLYARECCANAWYAIGAVRLRQGRAAEASAAFEEAIARVASHPMARVGRVAALKGPHHNGSDDRLPLPASRLVDVAMVRAAELVLAGSHSEGARIVGDALAAAPPGNAGWLVPVEPLLNVSAAPNAWNGVLSQLRIRAA
jgi:DNA-binding winged helix-turn-helix (wHTH) protein/cytochrome c-type biogenesis protein CcmH/NrfG